MDEHITTIMIFNPGSSTHWFSGRSWIHIKLEFGNVVFGEREKPEYPDKNLSE